ncbi:hypothetical protein [Roseiconus lacunae]|uniref:Uncharacterized protein n=1 Tax=Roseiconus lacunae TaxID=2605694 RepID=A0ABT7PMG1_9BACT|nr:hypothetical protein [Roseiconus lacunae]MDM4017698.1 hypothetical protein [Roseiconus lacunae]
MDADLATQVRDGVLDQTRPYWEEVSCGTLEVYDRNHKRVGTVYLGKMPESEHPMMTRRLTEVMIEVLQGIDGKVPILRHVTYARGHPQAYFCEVLSKLKPPSTGHRLKWKFGVNSLHACDYLSQRADFWQRK